jgi:hypothetical protein
VSITRAVLQGVRRESARLQGTRLHLPLSRTAFTISSHPVVCPSGAPAPLRDSYAYSRDRFGIHMHSSLVFIPSVPHRDLLVGS